MRYSLSVSCMQIVSKTVKYHRNLPFRKIVVIKSQFNNDAFMSEIVIFHIKGGMLWFCDLGYIYLCHWGLFYIYYKYMLLYGFWIYWPLIIKYIWLLKKISAVKLIKKSIFLPKNKKTKNISFFFVIFPQNWCFWFF